MLADSGAAWTDVVAQHNSGTYNNQYVVVDLKLFRTGKVSAVLRVRPGSQSWSQPKAWWGNHPQHL